MKRIMLMMTVAATLVACGSTNGKKSEDNSEDKGAVAVKKPDAPKRIGWKATPNLYGDVEQVKAIAEYTDEFIEASGGHMADSKRVTIWNFDKEGNVIERLVYDANNNLIERTTDFEEGDSIGDEDNGIVYVHDDKGNIIAEGYEENNIFIPYISYEYDAAGNKVKHSVLKRDGVVISETIYTYDEFGNLTEEAQYSLGGYPRTLSDKYTMTYDSYGNVVRMEYYIGGANMTRNITTYEITYRN